MITDPLSPEQPDFVLKNHKPNFFSNPNSIYLILFCKLPFLYSSILLPITVIHPFFFLSSYLYLNNFALYSLSPLFTLSFSPLPFFLYFFSSHPMKYISLTTLKCLAFTQCLVFHMCICVRIRFCSCIYACMLYCLQRCIHI